MSGRVDGCPSSKRTMFVIEAGHETCVSWSLASAYGKRGWSRVLDAYTSQVKSWFQKRRTHTEEDETTLVPHENDEKLRAENVVICDGHQDPEHPPRQSKRSYHRHTPRQIQELETMFKECPHLDEKQRQRLIADLGLQPRQVKFWFQSRRTQMKAQTERADKTLLRQENDKLRSANILMREALKNTTCQHCGGPSTLVRCRCTSSSCASRMVA
ncbi:unnamed protein product [Sphagnum tenellum]